MFGLKWCLSIARLKASHAPQYVAGLLFRFWPDCDAED